MKRAKFALTAIAIVGLIGGALAFKASQKVDFYSTSPDGACHALFTSLATTTAVTQGVPGAITTRLSTAPDFVNGCPLISIKPNN